MSLQRIFARGKSLKEKNADEQYKKEDITVRFMRSFATPITSAIYPINFITPNMITWFGFFLTIIGAIILFVADDNIILLFFVGFFYWLGSLMDCIDGQLARKRESSSKNGGWLDNVLEDGKGIPFFIALGFHIQDSNGYFTLKLGSISIITLHVWFTLLIMYMALSWLSVMSVWANMLLNEPRVVSQGNIYIVWAFTLLNLLDWFLVIYTVVVVLAAAYTLFEKTFLYSEVQEEKKTSFKEE